LKILKKKGKGKQKNSYFRAINTIFIFIFWGGKKRKGGEFKLCYTYLCGGKIIYLGLIVLIGTFHLGFLIYWSLLG
jgi:hypothetical protein